MTNATRAAGLAPMTARIALLLLVTVTAPRASRAQQAAEPDVFDPFFRFGDTAHKVYAQEAPGETVDPFSGTLRIVQEDLVLPGKAGLDLRIVRTYSSKLWSRSDGLDTAPLLAESSRSVLGYGWSFHMGRLVNPNAIPPSVACAAGEFPVFEGPDGETRVFYPIASDAAHPRFRSKDRWFLETNCAQLGGNNGGACVWSSDGLRYELSNAAGNPFFEGTRPVWPVSAIVDSIGNRISVAYVAPTGAVSSVSDSYGRPVTFAYTSGVDGLRLDSMTANGKLYSYQYTTYGYGDSGGPGRIPLPGSRRFLTEVVLPAGGSYHYEYAVAAPVAENQYALSRITYPHGGSTAFTYASVPFFAGHQTVPFSVVRTRTVGGRSMAAGTWTYDFAAPPPWCEAAGTCPIDPARGTPTTFNVTAVTRPDGRQDTFTITGFGWVAWMATQRLRYAYAVGLTAEVARADRLEVEQHHWAPDERNPISPVPYAAPMYGAACGPYYVADPNVWAALLLDRTILKDQAIYQTAYSDFDAYGQARRIVETGHDGGPSASSGATAQENPAVRSTTWQFFTRELDAAGTRLNMVRGRPLAQHVCIDGECLDNTWTYAGPGHLRDTETLSGVTTRFGHDATGNLETVTNALGETLRLQSYAWGAPKIIDLNGAYRVTREVSWEGWITRETNGRNHTTAYDYDAIGRPLQVTPPGNTLPTVYDYAPDKRPDGEAVRVSRGPYSKLIELDGVGREVGTSDSEGVFTRIEYDATRNVTFRSYPYGGPHAPVAVGDRLDHDGLGRPWRVQRGYRPDGTSARCDTGGLCSVWYRYYLNATETTVERSSAEAVASWHQSTSYGDPAEGRLTEVRDPHDRSWRYAYNTAGKLRTVTAPLPQGNRTFAYDSRQFLESEQTGESALVTYVPNAIGQVTSRTDARRITTRFLREDPLSRVTDVLWGTDDDVSRRYDAHTLKHVETRRAGAVDYGYDELDRLTSATWTYSGTSYSTSYQYDEAGCLRSVSYPTGTRVTMTCDGLNRPLTISIQRPGAPGEEPVVTDVAYHPSGQPAHFVFGNLVTTDVAYDDHARLETLSARGPVAGNVAGLSYSYDGAGNVLSFDNSAEAMAARTMRYDALDRLYSVTAAGQWGTTWYEYDSLGNRTAKHGASGDTVFVYESRTNRLAYSTGPSPRPLGLSWDAPGRLVASSDGATYAYDAAGRRIRKTDPTGSVVYHYDAAGRVIAETRPDGSKLRDYLYLGNKLVAVDGCVTVGPPAPCTERQWYHSDALGSVVSRTDLDGNVSAQFDYAPWGEQWKVSGVEGDRQYNGRVYDAGTGFHDYGARLYWPEIGRFVSADSYLGDPANPASLNRYSYVHNNPYKYVDPSGHAVFLPALYAAGAWCAMGGCQRLAGILAAAVELAPGLESALQQAQAAQQAQASTPEEKAPATQTEAGKDAASADSTTQGGTTKEVIERKAPGRDGGRSKHIIEKQDGQTTSKTHQVTKDGEVVHQHQDHVGKSGETRRFPDEWTGTKTINAPDKK